MLLLNDIYDDLGDGCLQAGQQVDCSCVVCSHQDSLKTGGRYFRQNSPIQIAPSGSHLDL